MADGDFRPEEFDTDWRVVVCMQGDERQVYEVSTFEFYGPAMQFWSDIDARMHQRPHGRYVDWQLIDPNGWVLLDARSHVCREPDFAANLPDGRYLFEESPDRYVPA